jgi:hypothetical protein
MGVAGGERGKRATHLMLLLLNLVAATQPPPPFDRLDSSRHDYLRRATASRAANGLTNEATGVALLAPTERFSTTSSPSWMMVRVGPARARLVLTGATYHLTLEEVLAGALVVVVVVFLPLAMYQLTRAAVVAAALDLVVVVVLRRRRRVRSGKGEEAREKRRT